MTWNINFVTILGYEITRFDGFLIVFKRIFEIKYLFSGCIVFPQQRQRWQEAVCPKERSS
jgi:hypothetical protein